MKPLDTIALILLSLVAANGCVLEVEAESDERSAWAQQPLTADDDLEPLKLSDNLAWADGQPGADVLPIDGQEWTSQNDAVGEGDLEHVALLPEGDPAPDPWRGAPEDESEPTDD